MIPIIIGTLGTMPRGTGRLGGKKKSGDDQDYSIIKISQNTERGPGDVSEKLSAHTGVKNSRVK